MGRDQGRKSMVDNNESWSSGGRRSSRGRRTATAVVLVAVEMMVVVVVVVTGFHFGRRYSTWMLETCSGASTGGELEFNAKDREIPLWLCPVLSFSWPRDLAFSHSCPSVGVCVCVCVCLSGGGRPLSISLSLFGGLMRARYILSHGTQNNKTYTIGSRYTIM
ncbi:hypothetical protein F5X96DRAFT_407674 [Biscogniauxia mediterranea]|nr:hypothetical protein F5X96DRAFT_407674 [Biscogniauxia mediterranea]